MYGKNHSDETKEKLIKAFSKEVIQLSLDGNFIREWKSIKLAQEGVNIKIGISYCCRGKQKTAGGYKWKYKNE